MFVILYKQLRKIETLTIAALFLVKVHRVNYNELYVNHCPQ